MLKGCIEDLRRICCQNEWKVIKLAHLSQFWIILFQLAKAWLWQLVTKS